MIKLKSWGQILIIIFYCLVIFVIEFFVGFAKMQYFGENCPPWKWRVKCSGRKCINCPQIGKFCKEKRLFQEVFLGQSSLNYNNNAINSRVKSIRKETRDKFNIFKRKSSKKTDILWSMPILCQFFVKMPLRNLLFFWTWVWSRLPLFEQY